MARTSAKAKKSKQEVNKKKEESKKQEQAQNDQEEIGDSTDKENDSTNYDVEKIVHTRFYKNKRQYLVRWKGYSDENDTWENESALQSCKEVLEAFKKEHLGEANSDNNESETEVEEKEKNKSKKSTQRLKKSAKSYGKSSKQTTKTESVSEDSEVEVEYKNEKGKNKEKSVKETVESDSDSKEKAKNKEAKGKKRNATKEKESSTAKKTKLDESDDESVTDGKDYEVEKILEVHTRKDGSREFLIRWKGYKPSDDTWEPEAHLDCQELIDKFMEKVDKAKELTRKELRERTGTGTKRFVQLNTRRANQRNKGLRPCYQESMCD